MRRVVSVAVLLTQLIRSLSPPGLFSFISINDGSYFSSIELYFLFEVSSLSLVLAMAYALSHLLMLLPLLPLSIVAQSRGVVNLGSSLSANEGSSPWLSPAGNFAFGFQKVDGNLFLLSIWYDKIPEKTIIWYADEGNPVPVGSKLVLTDTGLQLTSPQGEQLWISEPLTGGVATGYMNDTGNFAIKDENSQESWGSFRLLIS